MSTRSPLLLAATLTVGVAVSSATAAAEACTPSPCDGGLFIPEKGAMPANARGVFWWPSSRSVPQLEKRVSITDAKGHRVPFGIELESPSGRLLVLKPKRRPAPGTTLAIQTDVTCPHGRWWGGTGREATVRITPKRPLPRAGEKLGLRVTASKRGELKVATSSGACSEVVQAAFVDIRATLPAAVKPWADLLLWRTEVDGKPWYASPSLPVAIPPGRSWVGRGKDRVYRECGVRFGGTYQSLSQGKHTVVMKARVAGTTVELSTTPVTFELSCAGR